MTEERRTNQEPALDDLENRLNSSQRAALNDIQSLGWKLEFVRSPLFQEAVPVVYNTKFDQIGILDPDGNINLELEVEVRTTEAPKEEHPPMAVAWKEKRNNEPPIPGNLDEILNQHQMRALRQIERFGWQLHFVRRPLFQEPVPVIIGPGGEKFAILESDGRINMQPDSAFRKETTIGQVESVPFVPALNSNQAK